MTLPQAVVTPEMREIGRSILTRDWEICELADDRAASIYRAMRAVAPVELMSEGERNASRQMELLQARNRVLEARSNAEPIYDGGPDHLAALAGERDRALSRASHAMENWTAAVREREKARDENKALGDLYARAMTELMAARDTIAKLTSSVVPDTPSAAPNPFREFGGDRRRIGG